MSTTTDVKYKHTTATVGFGENRTPFCLFVCLFVFFFFCLFVCLFVCLLNNPLLSTEVCSL